MKYQALRSLAKLGFWFNREPQKELEDLLAEYDVLSTKCEVKPDLSAWCTCANEGPECCQRHPQPQSKVKLGGGVWVDFSKPPSEYLDLLDERNRLWAENKALLTKLEARPTVPEDVLVYLRKCAEHLLEKYDHQARTKRIQALETELSALRKEN